MPENEIYNWYLFHIAYQNEKKVKNILDIAGIEYYIPFHTVEYSWKGKQKNIDTPVFAGIGFARVDDFDLEMLKMMREISLFIQAENKFITFSDDKIQIIQESPALFSEELSKFY